MKIKIPASSANLGPGFDCFGIAWQCYNEIDFALGGGALSISGCAEKYQNRDNLAYRGYKAVLDKCGLDEAPLAIRFMKTSIPVSRGLGSSAALIVGGVVAANEIHRLGLSGKELLAIASELEGHPDNVAPALFGGFAVSTLANGRALSVPFPVCKSLHFTALIPDFELSTELSRNVLPQQLPRADAIFNLSRAALLLKALELGDLELCAIALDDKIHQPYRAKLIPGFDRARELALSNGAAGLCLSGAGSTLLCISDDAGFSARMALAIAPDLPNWKVISLLPDSGGATVKNT